MSTTAAAPPATDPGDRPARRPANPLYRAVQAIASLKLTVFLFVLAVLLIFFGTLAQMNKGIWTVVDKYFWSEYVWVDFQLLVQFGQIFFGLRPDTHVGGSFPFIGGRLLGFVMLVNLLAAHAVRFRFTWKRLGIWVTHLGLILLFVGEIGTRTGQVEQQMRITEGSYADYAFDTRNYELAVIDRSGKDADKVTVVPATRLRGAARHGERISDPQLPVDLEVLKYLPNARLLSPKPGEENPATDGIGRSFVAEERPEASGVDSNAPMDTPTAYVKLLKKGTDQAVGTFLVSLRFALEEPEPRQTVTVDGKEYDLSLRWTRYYKPFRMYLIDFRFDRYVGTQKAKNYSSRVRVVDPERGSDQEAVISMNSPLYYRGETYYQSNFDPSETTTILQVVRNPVWWVPYVACGMVAGGMLGHFGMYLVLFLLRTVGGGRPAGETAGQTVAAVPRPTTVVQKVLPWGIIAVCALYLLMMMVPRSTGRIDLHDVARVPVVDGGRAKPLDTYARVQLRLLNHKEVFDDKEGKTQPAIRWFLDTASATRQDPGPAAEYKVFKIENDQLIEVLGLKRREGLRYSLDELLSGKVGEKRRYDVLREEAAKANEVREKERTPYQSHALQLWRHVGLYHETWQGESPLILPPDPARGLEWRAPAAADQKVSEAVFAALTRAAGRQLTMKDLQALPEKEQERLIQTAQDAKAKAEEQDPTAAAWRNLLAAYRSGERDKFDTAVRAYQERVAETVPEADVRRVRFEAFLNEFAPTWHTIGLYGFVVLLSVAGWVGLAVNPGYGEAFRRSAFWVMFLTFLVHGVALFSRMYLMDRPLVFVTNLYSSAVFIGWAGVGLGLILERIFPLGLGNFVGGVLGFLTSIIAHNLAAAGDTLEMMQAVLDTNFWLATHVSCVTLGYASTYFAGLLGVIYVLLGVFTPVLQKPVALGSGPTARTMTVGRLLGMAMYGVVCLATLLSFTGTVLGGIWADFSWGRFWGWDPKENGAVLIVVWNALILHARWGGMVKDRGTAVLALIGNMITTWSWFGTNQLGVGLHAYGFSKTLAEGCMYTWIAHAGLILTALIPTRYWVSFSRPLPVGRPAAATEPRPEPAGKNPKRR